ncbi:hypothetical protein L873DRAFT_1838536 [Choiromyces venosus 120613-1]|uniref:FAD-binding PCMH-type domain-containing protein n=1 Tax=Choiromyces venosus 120613-1 TaxID=1336337 RepID=A0A3N4J677_9PEZI|nr:hypothetical protein L873DRAFT_1838536 [Choiromyces venosus 120613-1]
MYTSSSLHFYLNGTKITLTNVDPEATLLDFIHSQRKPKGTKLGCGEGGCGLTKHVITIEVLGTTANPHPLQERIAKLHGSQCSFCTCGIVMSLYALLRNSCDPEMVQLEGGLEGNLCQCTGYKPILDAAKSFSYEPHTEIAYPPALRKYTKQPIFYGNEKKVWLRPTAIEHLVELKHVYLSAKIVAGSSVVRVEVKFKHEKHGVSVYVGDIEGLKGFSIYEGKGEVVIGGNTSLTVLEVACLEGHKMLGKRGFVLEAIRKQLKYFAGRQIRNTATPAGNIVTALPISDLNPVLIASSTVITAQSETRDEFPLPMKEFFVAYRMMAFPADAIITKLAIPLPVEATQEVIKSYKQAKRKDDDIAIVTARFRVVLDESSVVTGISLAYGGMAPKTHEAKNTMEALLGKKWFDNTTPEDAMPQRKKETQTRPSKIQEGPNNLKNSPLALTSPGGSQTNRKAPPSPACPAEIKLGTQEQQIDHEVIEEIHRGISHGSRDNDDPHKQIATGEAEYIDDMPSIEGQLFGSLVLSKKAHAKLVKVVFTPALQGGEPFFAKDFVHSHGQSIGIVYAESAAIAQAAAQLVDVQYGELPPILTISKAIAARSFFPHGKMLIRGKPTAETFKDRDFVYEGISRIDGQGYFNLETNAAAVIPRSDDREMEVWSSTRDIMEMQEFVSQVTGAPSPRIMAKVKRMGGGFGGKESRSVQLACILAIAAKKVGRPIRCILNCDEDMMTSGQRNPFQAHSKVGVSKEGMLKVLDADVYSNAGYSQDLNGAVMGRALTHMDSCYWIPHLHLRGHVCKTNTHSNTAFRQYNAECILTAIADHLKMSVDKLCLKNLYKEGQLTPFLEPLEDWHVPQIITQLKDESDYDARVQQVEEFNRTHK